MILTHKDIESLQKLSETFKNTAQFKIQYDEDSVKKVFTVEFEDKPQNKPSFIVIK